MKDYSNSKTKNLIYNLSTILILIAAVSYQFNTQMASYIMIVGVIAFAITTFMTPYPGKNIRGKRLYNMQIFGVAFLAMATYLMYKNMNEWVLATLIAAILILYSSFLIPKIYSKEEKENKKNNTNK